MIPRPALTLIAVLSRNGVIGDGTAMPWHLPEDARHFRQQTTGCPVIMGRKTWDSLPERFRPLPGRLNLVVTRQAAWTATGATVASSLEAALAMAGSHASACGAPRVFVIGGAELYAAALPRADELQLTEIDADFEGDTTFPDWNRGDFAETSRTHHHAAPPNDFDFDFVTYRRQH